MVPGEDGSAWLLLGMPEDVLAPPEEWAEKPYVLTLHRHWNYPGSAATASDPQDADGLLLAPVAQFTIPRGTAPVGLADWLTKVMPERTAAWRRCCYSWEREGDRDHPEPTWAERSPQVRPSERSIKLRVFINEEAEPRDRPAERGHSPDDVAADLIALGGPPTEGILFAVGPAKQPNLMGVLVMPPGRRRNGNAYTTIQFWTNGLDESTGMVWDDPWRLCRYLSVTLESMLIRVEQAYRTGQSIRSPVATGGGATGGG